MDGANGLGKLLPKAITAKRKNRKQQKLARELEGDDASSLRRPSSNSDAKASSFSTGDDDVDIDVHNHVDVDVFDAGSLTSFESTPKTADPWDSKRPAPATPPPAPPILSAHPSQIGYLTTSSPVVQANHLDTQTHYQPPSRSQSDLSETDHSRTHSVSSSIAGLESSPRRSTTLDHPASIRAAPVQGRSRPQPRLDTAPPRTPPTGDKPAPLIVSTPPTPVEPVAAVGASSPERKTATPSNGSPRRTGTDGSSVSQSMSAHWRSRSGSAVVVPSKLSNATLPPLTPTTENGEETPTTSGFLSSVLSAAQSAASTLSNNIPGTGITIGTNKSRSSLNKSQGSAVPSQANSESDPVTESQPDNAMDPKKDLAVRTLGSGDLSLSQLGIAEPTGPVASPASAKFADAADLRTRSDSAPVNSQPHAAETLLDESSSRPRSLADTPVGDQSPPQPDVDAKSPVQRASSIRSAIKPHRKRGSSAATGSSRTTVGAAIAAAHSSAVQPSAGFAAPKLTGFAIASKRRNRDFHNLFKSVPDDDYLIEDYSCALQREILAHGRLYVSEGHLCFSSNILGWTTTLVMSFDEIVSVEKRSTALVFKNGLMISTLHAKHIFASFTSRDATYDLIVNIWKLGHPTLKSTLNGVRLEGTGGDKTEKVDAEPAPTETQDGSDSDENSEEDDEDEDDFYDEEASEHLPDTQATEVSAVDAEPEKPSVRKASGMTAPNGAPADAPKEAPSPPNGANDFPGPATHPPTDCGDSSSHYEKIIGEEIIPAPLGKVYTMIFGPSSAEYMSRWLTVDQKCTDLQMEDKRGLSLDNKTRNFNYIKPLNASIGPRQTKCIVTETLDNFDLEKAINLSVTTQNPDVPSGNVFSVKTKYCLSWAENNATRFSSNCTVEWTGKSWLKGPIEKGVSDGQTQYFKDLVTAIKASVSSKARIGATPNGPPRGKKRLKKGKTLQSADGGEESSGRSSHATAKNWGPLEPVRGILEPLVDVVKPLLTGNVMYGLLVGLVVAMWFGFGSAPNKNPGPYGPDMGYYSPYRLAAYEEMWRREESELWDWLEARIGPERLGSESPVPRKKAPEPRTFEEKLRQGRIDEKEMEEAIRVTEEKLKVLREVVAKTSRGQERASAKSEL